jgi:SAM-dependent methyltransferase
MSAQAYSALARYYDALTGDVPYDQFADFYEALFRLENVSVRSILDAACGTGSLTCLLAGRGYDMTGTDSSEDMLSEAYDKAAALKNRPLFLSQPMEALDLYGTVDAVICSLDGINYVKPGLLGEALRRVLLFLEPGGIFIFDIRTPSFLRAQDGEISLDETDDVYCVWRARFDEGQNALCYGMDLFALEGSKWARYSEEHTEYVYDSPGLEKLLYQTGFESVRQYGNLITDAPADGADRIFFTARKPGQPSKVKGTA